jgi:murein DD-endopeptidase MepM/ murein hydrolase activator NlpD
MIMPVAGRITSGFSASRLHPILDMFRAHKGVDLGADAGTDVVAPAVGRVISVDHHFGYGLVVQVLHSGSVVTLYAHLQKSYVRVGEPVKQGQVIAAVGSSGLATGPHLHFEVIDHGESVDPIKFLARSRDSVAQTRALYQGLERAPKGAAPTNAGAGGGTEGGLQDSAHRSP